jgi:hypothetical protein
MRRKAVRYLVYSQLSFFAFMTVCIVVSPGLNADGGAISNFGNYKATIVPYALSFVLSSFFLWKASDNLPDRQEFSLIRAVLRWVSMLNIAILLTPYKATIATFVIHLIATALLFIIELSVSIWLSMFVIKKRYSFILVAIQFLGFFIVVLSLQEVKVLEYLLVGQMLTVGSFALLITFAVAQMSGVSSEDLKMTKESQSPSSGQAA